MTTTKRLLAPHELATVVASLGVPVTVEYLDGGMFASAYLVTLEDGAQVVVKVAPAPGSPSLQFHEHDLMRSEVAVLRIAATSPEMRAPSLLHSDFSRSQIDVDVMVVTPALGERWDTVAGTMSAEANRRAEYEVGGVLAAFHAHVGTAFGVDALRAPLLSSKTWVGAFDLLLSGQLAEAKSRGVTVPEQEIREAALATRGSVQAVVSPRLLHGDLWRGNVFVDRVTGSVTCVIDAERSLWGDPLFDLAMADPMSVDDPPEGIVAGCRDAGLPFDLSVDGRARLNLYRLWLTLTMIVEITARGYEDEGTAEYEARLRADMALLLERLRR